MAKVEFSARSGLTYELDANGNEVFEDLQTGFRVIGYPAYNNINPSSFTLKVDNYGKDIPYYLGTAEKLLRAFELSFVISSLPTGMDVKTPVYWSTDKKPDTRGTGGARRNFVSVPLAMTYYTPQSWRKWYLAELLWNIDQLQRPFSHNPFKVSGDQYSKMWVNRNTSVQWNHEWTNASGWNCFDTGHADLARIAGLAAMGHPLGHINAHLVWRWLKRSCNGTTNWMTQPRGAGWVLSWGVLASFLNLTDQYDSDGTKSPQVYTREWVTQLINNPYTGGIGSNAPYIDPDWNGTGPQFSHFLCFQYAIMAHGILRVLKSGIIDGAAFTQTKADIKEKAYAHMHYIHRLGTDTSGRVSYTLGTTEFSSTTSSIQLAIEVTSADADNGGYTYSSIADTSTGGYRVRRVPQNSTAEVFAGMFQAFLNPSAVSSYVNGYQTASGSQWKKNPQYDLLIGSPYCSGNL